MGKVDHIEMGEGTLEIKVQLLHRSSSTMGSRVPIKVAVFRLFFADFSPCEAL